MADAGAFLAVQVTRAVFGILIGLSPLLDFSSRPLLGLVVGCVVIQIVLDPLVWFDDDSAGSMRSPCSMLDRWWFRGTSATHDAHAMGLLAEVEPVDLLDAQFQHGEQQQLSERRASITWSTRDE